MPETKPTIKELLEKITQGPWRKEVTGSNTLICGGSRPDPRLCYVYGSFTDCPEEERQAIADLIAIAPALARSHEAAVEALEEIAVVLRKIQREVGGNDNLPDYAGHFYRGYNAVLRRHQAELAAPLNKAESALAEAEKVNQ